MDYHLPDPPILSLNRDLLWTIFTHNANMYADEGALTTTRRSSQVCRAWRALLLDASSIWGKLIDLNLMNQPMADWRCEVLRRSGSSNLWIRWDVSAKSSRTSIRPELRSFFFCVINDHWERIEKIVYRPGLHDTTTKDGCGKSWSPFQRPSPCLRFFEIYQSTDALPANGLEKPLFANHAPLLRTFLAPRIPQAFSSQVQAPWLSNLREITLSLSFNIYGALEILQRVPLLETLEISVSDNSGVKADAQPIPCISLPRLQEFKLSMDPGVDIGSCLVFLEQLIPAPGCSLTTFCSPFNTGLSDSIILKMQRVFARYLCNYLLSHVIEHLSLRLSRNCFYFSTTPPSSLASCPAITATIWNHSGGLQDGYLKILLETFTESHICNVRSLTIDGDFFPHFPIPLYSTIQHLVSMTPAVESLQTTEETLRSFTPPTSPIPLAALRTLKLKLLTEKCVDQNYRGALMPFLEARRDAGSPIAMLDLTECSPTTFRHLEFLEELRGLHVVWTEWEETKEYRCGSGSPERLRLSCWFNNPVAYM